MKYGDNGMNKYGDIKYDTENFSAGKFSSKNSEYRNSGLVIEDDTVYEIDEECIACRNKQKKSR